MKFHASSMYKCIYGSNEKGTSNCLIESTYRTSYVLINSCFISLGYFVTYNSLAAVYT